MSNINVNTEIASGSGKNVTIVIKKPVPLSITKNDMGQQSQTRATVVVKKEAVPTIIKNEIAKVSLASNATVIVKKEMISPVKTEIKPEPSHIYQQRKCMLNDYKELFSVLMRFPDKEIQQKVLRCLNAKYVNKETQTDPVEILNTADMQTTENVTTNVNSNTNNKNTTESTPTSPNSSRPPTPKKRKRKRKVALPQASKESRVAQRTLMAKMNVPQKPKRPIQEDTTSPCFINNIPAKRPRLDSENSITSSFISHMLEDLDVAMKEEKMFKNIIRDCLIADVPLENGLLPIYDSIVKDKLSTLRIQIFIWKEYKKFDLNELITDDDEDLLQLAINSNCSPLIIDLLLSNNLNPNSVDCQSNTVLHLAVLNDIDPAAMDHLMSRIDLKMLLELNDDGYTCLQLAVRQDCYLLAESILNALDKRLSGSVFYKRDYSILETNENAKKADFKKYYEKVCKELVVEDDAEVTNNENIIKNHDIKQKLLQVPDMRGGCTALFFAIEYQLEHLIYFLLAHLSDPRTENLSGQDCKSFFSEFAKSLKLSLEIDSAMDKVIKILS
ncbi:uncharacterized protein LOC133323310 [Musca vetustissima]|uniref:uncharacterized protein LOC133323310 n=1 Tax=Musca vetustissima TaxID=27455 RepID=UPI002AB7A5DD|nr:uncharacterized protein LOC133323310 [Musca vetustissima]